MNMSGSTIIAGILFGSIGMVAFVYGRKQAEWRPMILGATLIGYPYLVSNNYLLWGIGAVLTVLLFVWK